MGKCPKVDFYGQMDSGACCDLKEDQFVKEYNLGNGKSIIRRYAFDKNFEVGILKVDEIWEPIFNNQSHEADMLEVGYIYEGEVELTVLPSGKQYFFRKGDQFIYRMINDVDSFHFKYTNTKAVTVSIDAKSIHQFLDQSCKGTHDQNWSDVMERLFSYDILHVQNASDKLYVLANDLDKIKVNTIVELITMKAHTYQLLALILNQTLNRCPVHECPINKAKIMIENNWRDFSTVGDIAETVCVSSVTLQQKFKALTGSTVYQFVRKQKMNEAASLLIYSDWTIVTIANELGYDNPSKFSSAFKKHYELSPNQFRNKMLD